jgi:hypothetical protein
VEFTPDAQAQGAHFKYLLEKQGLKLINAAGHEICQCIGHERYRGWVVRVRIAIALMGLGFDRKRLSWAIRYTFTLRELLMMQIMESVTDKPDWEKKVCLRVPSIE